MSFLDPGMFADPTFGAAGIPLQDWQRLPGQEGMPLQGWLGLPMTNRPAPPPVATPQPAMPDVYPTDISASPRLPMSIAPDMPSGPPAAVSSPAAGGGSMLGGVGDFLGRNSNMLMMLGAGIAGGQGWGQGVAQGLQGAAQGRQMDQQAEGQSATTRALVARGLSPEMASAVARNPDMLKAVLPQLFGGRKLMNVNGRLVNESTGALVADYSDFNKPTSDIQEYEYAKRQGFTGSLTDFLQRKRSGAGEYGLSPIWGTDAQGNPTIVQLGKGGDAIKSKIPAGVRVGKDAIKIDAGTHTVLLDPVTRASLGVIPKNIEQKEAAEEVGKARGQAEVALPGALQKSEDALKVIQQTRDHPGKNSMFGVGSLGWVPGIPGTDQRGFVALVDQLKGKAFLEAFESLKGGGAITEAEGTKAQNALARLERTQNMKDFDIALKDLETVIKLGMQRARQRAGQGGATPSRFIYDPTTNELVPQK